MAGMAQATKKVLISEVYLSHSVWREDDVNFRRKDITNKLWEEAAAACGMTSGKYFEMTGMLYSENQPSKYTYTIMP
jgi:hypothetical protein